MEKQKDGIEESKPDDMQAASKPKTAKEIHAEMVKRKLKESGGYQVSESSQEEEEVENSEESDESFAEEGECEWEEEGEVHD